MEGMTSLEDQVRDAAEDAGVAPSSVDRMVDETRTFLDRAQERLGEAVDSAVGAVREHPIAAAGIAAGAAAAVAGAAYGASRMMNGENGGDAGAKKKKG